MATINWANRTSKASIVRPLIWKSKRHFDRVLTLPSAQCEDVKYAIEQNTIDSHSSVIAVEREADTFLAMSKVLSELSVAVEPYFGDLVTVPLNSGSLDLANLDYQGNMRRVDVQWFTKFLLPALKPHANVFITGSPAFRGNPFYPSLLEAMQTSTGEFFDTMKRREFRNLSTEAYRNAACMMYLLIRLHLLDGYDATYKLEPYNDGSPMLVWGCTNIVRSGHRLEDRNLNAVRTVIQDVLNAEPIEKVISTHEMTHYNTISRQLAFATTSAQRSAVWRKMNHEAAIAAAYGKNPTMVIAGFKAAATRIHQQEGITQ
jgi:hypothetical protein